MLNIVWKSIRRFKHRSRQLIQQFKPLRYTDWRPNLLHGVAIAVFVGSRTVDSLLPPAAVQWKVDGSSAEVMISQNLRGKERGKP